MTAQHTIAPLEAGDVEAIAALHKRAFPTFFLSSLGERFLVQFYRGFLSDPTAVTVVARSVDGVPVGAVVGTTEPSGFFLRLLRRRWLGFALASAAAVLRRPAAAPRLLNAVRYRGEAGSRVEGALLSSVCVDPGLQGQGVGRDLLAAWEGRAAQQGASAAYLTTDADDNDAVNAFYRARGWHLADTFATAQGRRMNRYEKRLDPTP